MKRQLLAFLSVSVLGIATITHFEGFSPTPYADVGGVPTIGYGSTKNVKNTDRIDEKGARRRLISEIVDEYHPGLNNCIRVPLNQNEYDAYISLSYNIGIGAFCRSTLVKLLNQEKYEEACEQILEFNKVKVKVKEIVDGKEVTVIKKIPIKGLTNRRQAEHKLCLTQ